MLRSCLAVAACLIICPELLAQARPFDISGTIAGVAGNVISIKDANGNLFHAELSPSIRGPDGVTYNSGKQPSIVVNGTEDVKNLRAGHVLQFQAIMANKKAIVGEVASATLITVSPDSRVGILSADPHEGPVPGVEDDDKKKPAGMLENCLIVGQVTKAKAGAVTITFPGTRALSFKFAENAPITVSGANLTLARVGDKVSARGIGFAGPQFAAQEVVIEHSPAVDEKAAARAIKDVAKPSEKPKPGDKPGEKANPFDLDPEEKPAAAAEKTKVKLEIIKTE